MHVPKALYLTKPFDLYTDYVGFIKRVMKQVQTPRYKQIKKVDVELTTLEEETAPINPGKSRTAGRMQRHYVGIGLINRLISKIFKDR